MSNHHAIRSTRPDTQRSCKSAALMNTEIQSNGRLYNTYILPINYNMTTYIILS